MLNNNKYWRTKPIRSFFTNPGFMWFDGFTKPDGRLDISFPIVNYETSWMVTGMSMSGENGLTILDQPVLVSSDFYSSNFTPIYPQNQKNCV